MTQHPMRFDRIGNLLASRRSRRHAVPVTAGDPMTAFSAPVRTSTPQRPDASPSVSRSGASHPEYLFVQSFQSGTIAASDAGAGISTLTLEHGLGQTIYFSARPDRIVGATPTHSFLDGFGFPDDNPPNAALILTQRASRATDTVVVELLRPSFDPRGPTVTYDIRVLAEWDRPAESIQRNTPADMTLVDTSFDTAHLFIDDCPTDYPILCCRLQGNACGDFPGTFSANFCFRPSTGTCLPCEGSDPVNVTNPEPFAAGYWGNRCNQTFAECRGECVAVWHRAQP